MGRARTIAGVRITSPDRVLYPEQGVTKEALASYYARIGDWILPHLLGRPLSVVRCPRGRDEKCFFQKHLGEGWPEQVYGIDVEEKEGEVVPYIGVRDLQGLVSLVQFGVLEIHPWGSREDRLDRPDRLVFDLDPGPGVRWDAIVEAARRLRDLLVGVGLESFVRTTGGKGLHVVCPIRRRTSWDDAKAFAHTVAERLREEFPDRFVTNVRKNLRHGKILVDYLRNARGATAVASYSARARPGAPVAANLSWSELDTVLSSNAYTVDSLPRRLSALRSDPWERLFEVRQSITRAAMAKLAP